LIGVLVSGEGTNLQALIDEGLPIAGVISSKPGVPALDRAENAGIATAVSDLDDYETREARDGAMADWLQERGVDLVVCAGFMWLLRDSFLERFPNRVVNTHAAYLPEFPGASPIADALAAGAQETGATVHLVDSGIDSSKVADFGARVVAHVDFCSLCPAGQTGDLDAVAAVAAAGLDAVSRATGATRR